MSEGRGGYISHIGEVLAPALERIGPKGLWTESKIRKHWPELVGPELANHGYVVRLRGTSLVVGATSDVWATELRYLAGVLKDKLNERLGPGTITEIAVSTRRR